MSMAYSFLKAFTFKRGETPIHRLHPFSKMLFALIMTVIALIQQNFTIFMIALTVTLAVAAIAKVLRRLLQSYRLLIPLSALIFIANFVTLWDIDFSVSMVLRLLLMASAFSVTFMTLNPDEISVIFSKIRAPLDLGFIFSSSLRFIPTLTRETEMIIFAQRARALELDSGNIFNRVKNYIPILVPVIVCAIRRSQQLAEALETRGFNPGKPRTYAERPSFSFLDAIFNIATVTILLMIVYIIFFSSIHLLTFSEIASLITQFLYSTLI